jgi:sugar lactone lactonase YvrE
MVKKIEVILAAGDRCGEGIVWSDTESAIYWCDVTRFVIHRLNVVSRSFHEWHFDQPVVAMSLTTAPDILLVALGSRLILWNSRTDARVDHGFKIDEWPTVRLNEGKSDPSGRFWVGSMGNNLNADGSLVPIRGAQGQLYSIDAMGAISKWREAIGISNTLCWSPDHCRFYFGDSLANAIYSYDYNPHTGAIANEKPFFSGFGRGVPDGSAIDSEGFLWNCRFGGGCIVRIAPDGQVDQVVEMPIQNPTTCAFGGESLQQLFVASAGIMTEPSDRLAGSLFELDLSVKGSPEFRFRLS